MTESKRALGSNLARLDATTDEEIARHMVEDDSPELTDEDVARAEVWHGNKFLGHGRDFKNGRRVGRPKGSGTKEMVTLRLDRAVLAHFRKAGPGWQTRLNDTLAASVKPPEELRREAYDAGYAAAMQAIQEFSRPATTPKAAPGSTKPASVPLAPAAKATAAATGRRRRAPAKAAAASRRSQRGTNAKLIVEVLQAMPAGAARPADIRSALQRDKGVEMAFTSIRHALGQLATRREVVASDDGKAWRYLGQRRA